MKELYIKNKNNDYQKFEVLKTNRNKPELFTAV